MAEEPVNQIPVERELLPGNTESNGSDNVSRSCDLDFPGKLKDAELLLGYAAETGIEVDTKIRDAVLKARTVSPGKWSEETVANVLSALTSLAAKLKPVTPESLKLCAKPEALNDTIRSYKKVAIWLAAFIIPFSLAIFITSAISKAIQTDIEKANALAVNLGDGIRSIRAQQATGQGQARPEILPQTLQEFAAIVRAIDSRALQLSFFVAYTIADPFGRTWRGIWSKDRTEVRDSFELTPGFSDAAEEATNKIAVYQDVRYFAQSVSETVSTLYGAMATCVLPVLYALLGACAYLLRSFEEQFKLRTFNPRDVHIVRFLIAAIGGALVGLFNNFTLSQNATIPPLAIAFLVGYAVDVFFSFLEGLLQTFTRRSAGASQTQPTAKS